jgi:two-component system CheB/CheR fusion protein
MSAHGDEPQDTDPEKNPPANSREFEALLEYLKRTRGIDFTGYKRASPMRRIVKRMQEVWIEGFAAYTDYLEVHPEEFARLFNTILINVTAFFRDAPAWEHLTTHVLPRILESKRPDEAIRVWCAGCASGEEAYSLAMAFAEVMGEEEMRDRVKIYATDVDEEALARARHGTYSAKELEGVPPALVARYFEPSGPLFVFRKDFRRSLIFGRHDLIQDAPISRVDLLSCRNTLMYFNAEAQAKILSRFHYALNDTGCLFLGRAEMLLTHTTLFRPEDLKQRVFTKVQRAGLRDRLLVMAQADGPEALGHLSNHVRVREAAFDQSTQPQLVVDVHGFLLLANERARHLFTLPPADIGRPFHELELSYRPVELRSVLERVFAERAPSHLKEVAWGDPGAGERFIDVHVSPLPDGNGRILGAAVTFTDVTQQRRLQSDLERTNQELETAYEELQSTFEELETTNEELQSTVEELETTNEELQSTVEELETMNEELQSTNEELETMNEEVRRAGEELGRVNDFYASVLSSLRAGVTVLDRDLRVLAWNSKMEELWGVRAGEVVDRHFMNVDIGLPSELLRPQVRALLAGDSASEEVTLTATNRRGRTIRCKVICTPLPGVKGESGGVILLMEEAECPVASG